MTWSGLEHCNLASSTSSSINLVIPLINEYVMRSCNDLVHHSISFVVVFLTPLNVSAYSNNFSVASSDLFNNTASTF